MGVGDRVPAPEADWYEQAECSTADTAAFYRDERGPYTGMAWELMCPVCPVRAACLATALLNDERWGVWGGFTPNARASLLGELLEGTVTWEQVFWALHHDTVR